MSSRRTDGHVGTGDLTLRNEVSSFYVAWVTIGTDAAHGVKLARHCEFHLCSQDISILGFNERPGGQLTERFCTALAT